MLEKLDKNGIALSDCEKKIIRRATELVEYGMDHNDEVLQFKDDEKRELGDIYFKIVDHFSNILIKEEMGDAANS